MKPVVKLIIIVIIVGLFKLINTAIGKKELILPAVGSLRPIAHSVWHVSLKFPFNSYLCHATGISELTAFLSRILVGIFFEHEILQV